MVDVWLGVGVVVVVGVEVGVYESVRLSAWVWLSALG